MVNNLAKISGGGGGGDKEDSIRGVGPVGLKQALTHLPSTMTSRSRHCRLGNWSCGYTRAALRRACRAAPQPRGRTPPHPEMRARHADTRLLTQTRRRDTRRRVGSIRPTGCGCSTAPRARRFPGCSSHPQDTILAHRSHTKPNDNQLLERRVDGDVRKGRERGSRTKGGGHNEGGGSRSTRCRPSHRGIFYRSGGEKFACSAA